MLSYHIDDAFPKIIPKNDNIGMESVQTDSGKCK